MIKLQNLLGQVKGSQVTFLLETQGPYSGSSYLAAFPRTVLTIRGDQARLESGSHPQADWHGNAWDALAAVIESEPGWWFCALGYDLKNHDEHLSSSNPDPVGLPDLIAMQPSLLIELDPDGNINIIHGDVDLGAKLKSESSAVELTSDSTTREAYLNTIKSVKNDIHEGEYYELNLSHQLEGRLLGTPEGLFKQMAELGPVPMATYIRYHDTTVLSASPERYLKRTGDTVISEPIKGTRPRMDDPEADMAMKQELLNSEKEKAENLMIVDLVRNDLARVSNSGTVTVENLFEIRSYATVHQMVSTVKAEVSSNTSSTDILRNTFPMGSMTGAPKIRVMEAIESYETYRRGLYSGAVGYITPNGDFDFNVVIRSAFVKGDKVWYPVGGAITSDSDPEAEWDETLVKARALPQKGN